MYYYNGIFIEPSVNEISRKTEKRSASKRWLTINVLFVFCWDHECVSAYGMCPLVVVGVVVLGEGVESFESKSSAMTMNK